MTVGDWVRCVPDGFCGMHVGRVVEISHEGSMATVLWQNGTVVMRSVAGLEPWVPRKGEWVLIDRGDYGGHSELCQWRSKWGLARATIVPAPMDDNHCAIWFQDTDIGSGPITWKPPVVAVVREPAGVKP